MNDATYSTDDSDLDLARRVSRYLAERQRPALRQLKVEAASGTVRLSGNVGTFYEKQLSQHCTLRVAGVRELIDEVHVVEARPRVADSWSDSHLFHAWSDHAGVGA